MGNFKEKLVFPIAAGFCISLIGFGFNLLQSEYNKPRIIVDTTKTYADANGVKVGNIAVWNAGETPDSDITINVYSKLRDGTIRDDGPSANDTVVLGPTESKFVISKLNPGDGAVISFVSGDPKTDFGVAYSSQSGKVEETVVRSRFWEFNLSQLLFLSTFGLLLLLIGIYIGKPAKIRF